MRRNNEVGKIYGKLVVLEFSHISNNKTACWLCRCKCGKQTIVQGDNLRSGGTQSCGCGHFKGGLVFHKRASRWYIRGRGGIQTAYARAVMERFLGRELNPEWVVHHRNEDSTDDDINNPAIFISASAHTTYHNKIRR